MAAPASDAPRIRVAALMTTDDGVVLVRHSKSGREYHLLPGGGVDWGESLPEALVREVLEETGLTCEPGRIAFVADTIAPDGSRHVVNVAFYVTISGGSISADPGDPRVAAVEIVALDRLQTLDLRPPVPEIIAEALQSAQEGFVGYVRAPWTPEDAEGGD